jgi:hypothetical protein
MQPRIVGFALDRVFLAVKERQEGIAPSPGDGRHLMQRAARKHQRAAFRRPVGLVAEFRKYEIAAFEIMVEIDREREPPVLRPGVDVVAIPVEVGADLAVVAGHDIAIHPRGGRR